VATFSYSGPLVGPVLIGMIADRWSLTAGLLLPIALAVGVALAAGNLRPATPDPIPAPTLDPTASPTCGAEATARDR
jgi:hypothetical protein